MIGKKLSRNLHLDSIIQVAWKDSEKYSRVKDLSEYGDWEIRKNKG